MWESKSQVDRFFKHSWTVILYLQIHLLLFVSLLTRWVKSVEEIGNKLANVGIPSDVIGGILQDLSLPLFELENLLGSDGEGISELKQLFSLANDYGYVNWIQFDASVVHGLAYYIGTVFEGFGRDGKLRAICGGDRYDRLFSAAGGEDIPACSFGFGDTVIVELLREKKLIPVST